MNKQRRTVIFVLIGMFLMASFAMVSALPDDQPPEDLVDSEVPVAPINVQITLEHIDPAAGIVTLSLQAVGDPDEMGPEGATLVTDIPGIAKIVLPQSNFAAPVTADVTVDGADVSAYPFDGYPFTINIAAFEGNLESTSELPPDIAQVPLVIQATSALSGFDATADVSVVADSVTSIEIDLNRQPPIVAWAVSMMAIYWLLASAALAVAVAILAGVRPFETRHLAWLTAIIFAFAAFRNTAPGSPPIGVFLDFGAFFWAVGVVVLAELLLLGYYLFSTQESDV